MIDYGGVGNDFLQRTIERSDDGVGRSAGCKQGMPIEDLELRPKCLHETFGRWKLRRFFLSGYPVSFYLSSFDLLHHGLRCGKEQIDMTSGDILQGRRRAAIGNEIDFNVGLLREE